MATAAPITGAPFCAQTFKLNGVALSDEPEEFLEQAHALTCCLDEAADPEHAINRTILQSAVRGIGRLIYLAAVAVEEREKARARSGRTR